MMPQVIPSLLMVTPLMLSAMLITLALLLRITEIPPASSLFLLIKLPLMVLLTISMAMARLWPMPQGVTSLFMVTPVVLVVLSIPEMLQLLHLLDFLYLLEFLQMFFLMTQVVP